MTYDGITTQRISQDSPDDLNIEHNGFGSDEARDVASKVDAAIAAMRDLDVTPADADDLNADTIDNTITTIAEHEHPSRRVYAAVQPTTQDKKYVQKTSRQPKPSVREAQAHAYVFAQPQIGSVTDWDDDNAAYEHPTNRERIRKHVADEVTKHLTTERSHDIPRRKPIPPRPTMNGYDQPYAS